MGNKINRKLSLILALIMMMGCLGACGAKQEEQISERADVPEETDVSEEANVLEKTDAPEEANAPEEADVSVGTDVSSGAEFILSDKGKDFLVDMCYCLPDFSGSEDMDDDFWWNFIFYSYTGGWGDAELVNVFREDLGFEETEVKVSLEEAEAHVKLALGVELPDFKPAFADMEPGQTALYFEDGYYYIGVSDFPAYLFTYESCETKEEQGQTVALVTYHITIEDEEDAGTVTFNLITGQENENGFIVAGKATDSNW